MSMGDFCFAKTPFGHVCQNQKEMPDGILFLIPLSGPITNRGSGEMSYFSITFLNDNDTFGTGQVTLVLPI
jgi:hypothetical protein